jgi:hypothetical protein
LRKEYGEKKMNGIFLSFIFFSSIVLSSKTTVRRRNARRPRLGIAECCLSIRGLAV